MRISDWSSDGCSSDLVAFHPCQDRRHQQQRRAPCREPRLAKGLADVFALAVPPREFRGREIGRASWRERVCSVRVDCGGRRIIKNKKQNTDINETLLVTKKILNTPRADI